MTRSGGVVSRVDSRRAEHRNARHSQTSSLIEFPNQARLVEVTDEDNGYVSIQLVGIDFATDGDDVAEHGRVYSILDHTSGWGGGSAGLVSDRNVKLYVPVPATAP